MACLLLLGAGGHARVVAETALTTGFFTNIAFLDDRYSALNLLPHQVGWPVIGRIASAFDAQLRQQFPFALVAIGNANVRLHLLRRLMAAGYEVPVLVHPTASLSPSAQLGPGSVVFAHASIQAQALIGSGVILNTCCSVDHDVQIGNGVHVCPGARLAGQVQVGDRSWIGIGSSVIQQIRIGSDVMVGAGAAVVRDLPDSVTAVGVPARVLPTT